MKDAFGAKKSPALLIGFGKADEGEEGDEDTGALAGCAFGKAVKSGDGAAIYSAFESLYQECKSKHDEAAKPKMDTDQDAM